MTDQPLLAELVGEHMAAHPFFLKGYAHGVEQERKRILKFARFVLNDYDYDFLVGTMEMISRLERAKDES